VFKINQYSSMPIYQQLIQQIKEAVLKGILQPGDKLPSVRELSVHLTINPNTIQKSYQELERQKVIETLRGKGTFISTHYKPREDDERLNLLKENLRNILVDACYLGLNKSKILEMMAQLMEELKIKDGENS